jgi:hypothetical protein
MADEMIMAGAAAVDVTPPAGLMLCGYAARTEPARGTHDALTARALVVGDTAIVVADVLGLHEESCARIRQRAGFGDRLVVVATHTHGGPMSMSGRGGGDADPAFLEQLEDGCVEAVRRAGANRQPARLLAGNGANPSIAFNRRTEGGPIDPTVPVLRVEARDGTPLAVAFAHGCHPVVLGAGNRLYTADFPHFARAAVEAAHPGAVALFLPGCSGDVSTGHSPESSISTETPPDRTFARPSGWGGRWRLQRLPHRWRRCAATSVRSRRPSASRSSEPRRATSMRCRASGSGVPTARRARPGRRSTGIGRTGP